MFFLALQVCASANAAPLAEPCRADGAFPAILVQVKSDGSLLLARDDMRDQVRLADIGGKILQDAELLNELLAPWIGRRIVVHPLAAEPDRWMRRIAHVEMGRGESFSGPAVDMAAQGIWLQEMLVRAGLAEVRPEGSPAGCAAALYRGEWAARKAKRGLWNTPEGRVLSSRDSDLDLHADAYRIVAGIVVSVGATSRKHYLNFGHDWSRDFTVTIPAGRAEAFRAAGRDPEAMAGRYVRVRGWLEKWNGTVIEIRQPDAIEVFGRGD